MVDQAFHTDRNLRQAGLTPESIQAIKSTTVITKDGAQHVVPESQAHLSEEQSSVNASLQQQVQDVSRMFSRFKQFSDQRLMKLEQQVAKLQETVKEQESTIMTLRSNAAAQKKYQQQPRDAQEAFAQEATEEHTREVKETVKPKGGIDRNKVDPSDVQVENIFYSGTR